ncbi:glycosyltransferase family 2 protein [Halobacillus sp. A1]|uniref:glycosyltransferase n=1 Tax=Halobacillus sp. A1 TaxID=2880262 RepID=UPI0020A64930|nr:glycosyltransferase family 2 protein [Halobacillus sp. A1]MCP3030622.1 glycosyltransferase family 2 protein [Halobacillus sp. A1]
MLTTAVICTFLLNVWTIINSIFLPKLKLGRSQPKHHKVSLLVPLRNEEENVEGLVRSLKKLTYTDIEFVLLDDHSEDDTLHLLQEQTKEDSRFNIVTGEKLPEGWNGKVFACHQLAEQAEGDLYFFLDADARVQPSVIEKTIATMEKHGASMLSGFPKYPNYHFLAHMLVPLQHMVVLLHLPLAVANFTLRPAFTAACGIFIVIKREVYENIGGHASVKNSLVEDVHIAREVKKQGYKMLLCNITDEVISFMYDSSKETWEGFKKNIYTGVGRSPLMVIFLTITYLILFLMPFTLGIYGVLIQDWIFVLPFLLTVCFKMYIDTITGHPLWLAWLLPVSIILLISILFASMSVHIRGQSYHWKGRSYK